MKSNHAKGASYKTIGAPEARLVSTSSYSLLQLSQQGAEESMKYQSTADGNCSYVRNGLPQKLVKLVLVYRYCFVDIDSNTEAKEHSLSITIADHGCCQLT